MTVCYNWGLTDAPSLDVTPSPATYSCWINLPERFVHAGMEVGVDFGGVVVHPRTEKLIF